MEELLANVKVERFVNSGLRVTSAKGMYFSIHKAAKSRQNHEDQYKYFQL